LRISVTAGSIEGIAADAWADGVEPGGVVEGPVVDVGALVGPGSRLEHPSAKPSAIAARTMVCFTSLSSRTLLVPHGVSIGVPRDLVHPKICERCCRLYINVVPRPASITPLDSLKTLVVDPVARKLSGWVDNFTKYFHSIV
jgi:hypothetical protein